MIDFKNVETFTSIAAFIACVVCFSPPAVYANPLKVEEVFVSGSRINYSQDFLSTHLSLLDEAAINTVQAEHINQVFSRVAGAWVSRGNGQEHLTAIRSPVLTGAGGCGAFYMAQDGISLRAAQFCNANQLFDVNFEQARGIEVFKGPASVSYGSNALHGVVNVISLNPLTSPRIKLGIEAGPHDYFRHSFIATRKQSDQAFAVHGVLTSDGGYKEESGYDQQKINLVHQSESELLSVKTHVGFTNLNQETAGFIQGLNAYNDEQLRRLNPNPEAYRDSQTARAYSVIQYQPSSAIKYTFKPYLRWASMEFLQHFLPWQAIETNSHASLGLQSQVEFTSEFGRALIGVDSDITKGKLQEFQPNDFSETIPQGSHYDYTAKVATLSPFAQFFWQVSNRLNVNTGVRFDYVGFDYNTELEAGSACALGVTNCRFTRPQDQKVSFNYVSKQAGFNYLLAASHYFYGMLSNGFRAPQATELFRLQGGQTTADLEPEEIRAFELGFRGGIESVSYNVSAYTMRKANFIFQDTNRLNINEGETSHVGIEATIKMQLPNNWYASINGTFAKHRYENNLTLSRQPIGGNEIDTAPGVLASAQVGWRNSKYAIEIDAIKQGEYFLNPENTASYNGHNVLNIRGDFNWSDQVKLGIKMINLADKNYAERADFAFGNYRYFVGEPRSIYVTATFKLTH